MMAQASRPIASDGHLNMGIHSESDRGSEPYILDFHAMDREFTQKFQ